ncbi:uncharacterized protein [Henckelia pumila]|uniref:uncharacterized protein isoform X1 n=1 Tax=Henckelia pumila TaxID=405737 RepID=UPI003C6DF329
MEEDRADCILFVDPGHLPTCPLDNDDSHLSQHIANHLEAVCRDNVCLIPYNTGGVKLYNATRGIPKWPGFKQLTGNLKQSGSVECGYYVMSYMKEIVECEVL